MKIQCLELIHCGEIPHRKKQPLDSDLGIPSIYTLVSVVLATYQRIWSIPHIICVEAHWIRVLNILSHTVKYIWSPLPPCLIQSLIHKLKIDQEQLKYIQHFNKTPFHTLFQHYSLIFSYNHFYLIHNVLIDYIAHVVVLITIAISYVILQNS